MTIQNTGDYIPAFKAEIALAALRGDLSPDELASRHNVHANEVAAWRQQLERHAALIFSRSLMPAPRSLPNNPFEPCQERSPLDECVHRAIAESAKYGRSVGVVAIPVVACEEGTDAVSAPLLEDLASKLRESLRASDHVAPAADGSVCIYLSLLNSLDDLHSIARRLTAAAAQFFDNNGHPEYTVGKAGVAFSATDGDAPGVLVALAQAGAKRAP